MSDKPKCPKCGSDYCSEGADWQKWRCGTAQIRYCPKDRIIQSEKCQLNEARNLLKRVVSHFDLFRQTGRKMPEKLIRDIKAALGEQET